MPHVSPRSSEGSRTRQRYRPTATTLIAPSSSTPYRLISAAHPILPAALCYSPQGYRARQAALCLFMGRSKADCSTSALP